MTLRRRYLSFLCAATAATFLLASPLGSRASAAEHLAPADCGTADLLAGKAPKHQEEARGDLLLVTDGTIVPDGAEWDAPEAITWESRPGSLTYDLGKATQVSAFFLQADANDVYLISGSLDDAPGSYRVIARAANVVERGPGLRTRLLEIEPATVRYLRIATAEGDGFYSIAELAAYCRRPTPFPPQMHLLDAPMAVGPIPAGEPPAIAATPGPKRLLGPFERVLAAMILLLVAARLLTAKRRGGAATADSGLATDALGPRSDPSTVFPFLFLLFMISGAAALIYEVVWFQMLQLVLGSSAVSIGVLLGTFMGGMCLGSLGLSRFVSPRRHPLRVYALLELAIGASGILMLGAMPLVEGIYTSVVGHGLPSLLWRGLFAALCLLPPTTMMGATLPAVARWVRATPRGVSWLGYLYAANTTGAVFGCLVAGFYLLRVYNVSTATFIAVALNVVGAAGALALARSQPRLTARADSDAAPSPARPQSAAWIVYLTIGLSGVSALGAEVIWTRLFALLLGATTYTFSIILAVFLIGIGLGSSATSFLLPRSSNPLRALGVVQLLLIAAIAWAHWNISSALPYWPVNPQLASGPWYQFQIDLVRSLWAILPAACLWGASFPLALAAVASETDDGGRVLGRLYAANTVGAILGSLAMSLIVITTFGTQNGERILIGLAALAALIALVPLARVASVDGKIRLQARDALWILVVVEIASLTVRHVAPVPPLLIGHGRLSALEVHNKETFLYVGEGMNSSPVITRDPNGIVSYHNAGKVQASSQPQDMRLQRMLGHLTTFVPEHPRSVLVIACGAGVTAGAASIDPRVEKLTIAEIEPLVPEAAAKYFGDYNFNVVRNPKVHVEIDDARHFLNTTKEKFDAITSDPFDPWVKGAANLYTKEFWEMVRAHLNPGGVATVFVQLYLSGLAASKSEIATFFQAFPNALIWGNPVHGVGYDTVLMGRVDGGPIDVDQMQRLLERPDFAQVARSLRQIGFNSAIDLLSTYAGRDPELRPWLADAEINRDDNLRLQFLAGFDLNLDQREQTYREILSYRQYPPDLFTGTPATLGALREAILKK
jgi:spermidine synthase